MNSIPQPQTSVLNAFQLELLSALAPYMEDVTFAAGDQIYRYGQTADGFYVIETGDARIEIHSDEMDTDNVLDYVGPGSFLGEVSVLAGAPRWDSAYAETDITAKKVPYSGLRRMFDEDPVQGVAALRALARDTAMKYRDAAQRLSVHIATEQPDPEVERMVSAAVAAQREFESWSEERVDALLKDLAETVAFQARELAEQTVAETTLGVAADKEFKIQFASLGVYGALAGATAYGPIAEFPDSKITEIAAPVGVVFGLVPVTNPVPTFINKTLICLKGRNALILSCHRMAQGIATRVGTLMTEVLLRHGAPENLFQWVQVRTSRQRTAKFMSHPKVGMILATGGPGMVKAAYSSGKPAIGVGAGNAPAWVAADADPLEAARKIISSKTLDNGLICGSEQHIVVDKSLRDEFVRAIEGEGAAVLGGEATKKFVDACFDPATGHLKIEFVGRTADVIAQAAGLDVPAGCRLLVFSPDGLEEKVFGRERLAPVLSLFTVDGDEEALGLCQRLLSYEGAGHTATLHSHDVERQKRFAREMPASRVLINAPAAQGCCGVVTGLNPSLTLGCGTWGGNSTNDNVGYKNLLNIKRMAEAVM